MADKKIDAYAHDGGRKNIPTAELQSLAERVEEQHPVAPKRYPRATPLKKGEVRDRDEDLDPQLVWRGVEIRITQEQARQLAETGKLQLGESQLVWRGKDTQDWSDLVVNVPPIYVQEKIHPRVIIDELKKMSDKAAALGEPMVDLFADFNGIDLEARTEFYAHDVHWTNRMILGDSLQVMASLAEREGLRGKVQCIYFDPPYGIKFNSNWQVSTRERDVKDGKLESLTREPEQVKAFRDTWKDGIHSYLTYLRDRLTVARDLLTASGSIFVQIGDENVHRVRALMDEVFGEDNYVSTIVFQTTSAQTAEYLSSPFDQAIWFAKDRSALKYRRLFKPKSVVEDGQLNYPRTETPELVRRSLTEQEVSQIAATGNPVGRIFRLGDLTSQRQGRPTGAGTAMHFPVEVNGKAYFPTGGRGWSTTREGMRRLASAGRIEEVQNSIRLVRYHEDAPSTPITALWDDTGTGSFTETKVYVVQTGSKAVARCILMATDPGDIVLDPTCGSGTAAQVSEQWGRKWITIDTSRVALALARTRLMAARYPYYLLRDSAEGRRKEAELTGIVSPDVKPLGDLKQGFVYERAPHITLKSIANNAEIDVIWEGYRAKLEPLREAFNAALGRKGARTSSTDAGDSGPYEEWEFPRNVSSTWPAAAKEAHARWWELRVARQKEIDASIGKKADVELLYDRPYEDKSRVRVAGPFTVESLSPHRVIPMDDRDDLLEEKLSQISKPKRSSLAPETDFAAVVLENLKTHGVQQGTKQDRLTFTHLAPWPGVLIAAEGHFNEGSETRRAAILLGPEYGSIQRTDITAAAREATDARFDVLIACGFAFDAHSTGLNRLGALSIIKAKMNPDLHMASDLKNTGKGNLFMVIGEPDLDVIELAGGDLQVKLHGMDVFVPATGEIRSGELDDIAAWFIDTAYNEESFFVRHAYFVGAGDPYKALKTSLRAEINEEAWASLNRDISRPFPRPKTNRIAVKVINHFGDEVMKVFSV